MLNICIQNLGLYNEGILLFKWLTLPATEEEIDQALTEIKICHENVDGEMVMFTDCFGNPYEELHIPDLECDFNGIEYYEWAQISYYNELAEELENLDDTNKHWLSAYMEDTGYDFEDALYKYQDNSTWWEGHTTSDVAREIADEQMSCMIPRQTGYGCDSATKRALEWLQEFFDYEAFERSLYGLYETNYGVIETY